MLLRINLPDDIVLKNFFYFSRNSPDLIVCLTVITYYVSYQNGNINPISFQENLKNS